MFKHKYFIVISLLAMLCIVTISSASAVDLNGTDDAISDDVNAIEDSVLELEENEDTLDLTEEDELATDYQWFSDIQNKINQAEEGSTINLSGTYYGRFLKQDGSAYNQPIIIDKPIRIVGTGDGAILKANINSATKYPVFYIYNTNNVLIDNLKISGGLYQWGGGIFVDSADHTTISNCEFKDNSADGFYGYGGAIYLCANNCTVTNCTFTNNHCTDYGGAIYVNQKNNTISNCKFMYNYISNEIDLSDGQASWRGGGAIYTDCDGLTVDNCTFVENYAREASGGAIKVGEKNVTVKNSIFRLNIAASAKAVWYSRGNITLINNTFSLEFMEDPSALFEGINIDELPLYGNVLNKTKHDSSVMFSAGMIYEYATSGSIYVTVDGGSIDPNSIRVLNHPEAKITFANNVITVSNLNVGKYTLKVTTIPDEDHNSVDSELSITVKKAIAVIKASSTTVALKKGTAWAITLVNSKTGKPIVNMALTLKVYTGSKYKTVKVTTNSKGVATFKTGSLAKGNHKIVVSATHSGYTFNTLTSSIKVIKPTALKFKLHKRVNNNKGSLVTYQVLNKKTKKGVNGIKVEFKIYTGKTYKTITLKTKKVGKYKGIAGFFTNEYSIGKHKVVIVPTSIKYDGSGKTTIVIKSSAKKYPSKTTKS